MEKFTISQKLAQETHPTLYFRTLYPMVDFVFGSSATEPHIEKAAQDPQLAEFYSTYTYETLFKTTYLDYEPRDRSQYKTRRLNLGVSNNTSVSLVNIDKYVSPYEDVKVPSPGIYLTVNDKTMIFDINQDIVSIHKAAMIYSYALNKLDKMPVKEAYGSRYHKIKLALEEHFKCLKAGIPSNLDLDTLVTKEELAECISIAKATTLKNYLINVKLIPAETGRTKYPTTYEELIKVLPTVEAKLAAFKQKAERKQQKVLAKQKRKELKLAKQKEKKAFKQQKKEQEQEQIKSVRDVDFTC